MTTLFQALILGFLFILGLITGGLSNVTSGGGGIFTTFVLDKYYNGNLSIQQSIGTVLAASTVMIFVGAVSFYRKKEVDKQLSLTVGISGVVGAFLSAELATSIQSLLLQRAFGAFTACLAVYMSFEFIRARQRRIRKAATMSVNGSIVHSEGNAPQAFSRWRGRDASALAVQIGIGLAIGLTTGLFGGGGGLTMAIFLFVFKLPTKLMIGTSLMASLFRYGGASVGYALSSSINIPVFLILAVGGAIGSLVGARIVMSGRTKDSYIQIILVALFLFISYEFLLK